MTELTKTIYTPEERERLAELEYKRLGALFKSVEGSKRKLIDGQLQQAAFLAVTLVELQSIIRRDGVTEAYQNGAAQHGMKPSAAVQTYDKLQNTYTKIMAQLRKEMPESEASSELMDFIMGKHRDDDTQE